MDVDAAALNGNPNTNLNVSCSWKFDSDKFFCAGIEVSERLAAKLFDHGQFSAEPGLAIIADSQIFWADAKVNAPAVGCDPFWMWIAALPAGNCTTTLLWAD